MSFGNPYPRRAGRAPPACEAGLQTFLVLTGSTRAEDVGKFPFRPSHVVDSIADLVARV